MNAVLETPASDGRWLRSIRTREAIIDAWLELIDLGDLAPTAKDVADRAGVGLRTVFQHFADMNALHHGAGAERAARIMPTMAQVPVELPLAERIEQIAASRSEVFEELTSLRRACERQEWLSEDIHGLIAAWEAADAASVERIFASEIEAVEPAERASTSMAVDAVVSWSHWNHLRQRRDLSVERSRSVVRHSLAALLR